MPLLNPERPAKGSATLLAERQLRALLNGHARACPGLDPGMACPGLPAEQEAQPSKAGPGVPKTTAVSPGMAGNTQQRNAGPYPPIREGPLPGVCPSL